MSDNATWGKFNETGTRDNPIEDPNVMASATTIAPTYRQTRVSGTTAIVTITVPFTGFQGTIALIPTGIWTWTAAGNIAVLGTTTAALCTVFFTYSPYTSKWYPSRVA